MIARAHGSLMRGINPNQLGSPDAGVDAKFVSGDVERNSKG